MTLDDHILWPSFARWIVAPPLLPTAHCKKTFKFVQKFREYHTCCIRRRILIDLLLDRSCGTLMGLLHTSGYSQQPSCYKNCTRNCIRNKTFLFVKIETWNFQNLYDLGFFETSQNFIYLSWQTKKICS